MDNIEDNNSMKRDEDEKMEWIKSIFIAIILALFIKTFIFNSTLVSGSSMYPTLFEDDRLFSVRVPLYLREPKRSELIVFKAPDHMRKDYIKRVIGIEGDIVEIKNGKVYLNGSILHEGYIEPGIETSIYGESKWIVKENELFVLGDNRREGASKDSRYFGTIHNSSVKGIVNFRYYPLDYRFGKINNK